jgi:hypothetical protein
MLAIKVMDAISLPIKGKKIMEIGPKHGRDTKYLDKKGPRHITICELESKRGFVNRWIKKISSPNKIFWGDFIKYQNEGEKFDIILCSGVIYHNINQMGIILKVHKLLELGGIMVIESSTTRNKELKNKNVIDVHWPPTYEGTTVKFHPSKKAVRSMCEMSGFEIVEEKEEGDRICFACKKVKEPDLGYKEISSPID